MTLKRRITLAALHHTDPVLTSPHGRSPDVVDGDLPFGGECLGGSLGKLWQRAQVGPAIGFQAGAAIECVEVIGTHVMLQKYGQPPKCLRELPAHEITST